MSYQGANMTITVFLVGVVAGLAFLMAVYGFISSAIRLDDHATGVLIQALIFILLSGIAALLLYKFSNY